LEITKVNKDYMDIKDSGEKNTNIGSDVNEGIEGNKNTDENKYSFDVQGYALNALTGNEMPGLIRHSMDVSNLAYAISKEMGMDEEFSVTVAKAALLHDIGKVKVYFYLFNTDEERLEVEKIRQIKMHSKFGYDILKSMDYDDDITEAVLYHHENYDGSGYPGNLKGEDIPLSARIIRVSDTFCALVEDRSYREAYTPKKAIELMIDEVKYFDMQVFLSFMKVIHKDDIREKIGLEE